MGGAGAYTILGARIVAGAAQAKSAGWIVDCGSDFPPSMREEIDRWGTSCLFRETPERLTTRGWNGYGEGEQRAFKYTTPKLRLDENSLTDQLLQSKSFHLVCSPTRCMSLVEGILARRAELVQETGSPTISSTRPIFVWEPIPDLCTPAEWENCKKALRVIDIVSPNHVELAEFLGKSEEDVKNKEGESNREAIVSLAQSMAESGIGVEGMGCIVVRAGKGGCCTIDGRSGQVTWLPPYHQEDSEKVVDPTGAGNTFLGGLAMALTHGQSIESAAALASIVAGVAVEQVGMPHLNGRNWNDKGFRERCALFERRCKESGVDVKVDSAICHE